MSEPQPQSQPAPAPASEIAARVACAEDAIREAGALALRMFRNPGGLTVTSKGLQDQATDADRAVEALLRARLTAAFAEDGFLGEEGGAGGGGGRFTWVVDPIDGTQCYLSGIPVWCLSVALLDSGRPAAGLVFDPGSGEMFHAVAGQGARLNGRALRASGATSLHDGVVGVGFSQRTGPEFAVRLIDDLARRGGMFQRNGSGALMLAYVAAGRLLGYAEAHINAWDCLAGLLLIAEAGGWHNAFLAGGGLDRGGPVLGAAPGVAAELRAMAARAGPGLTWA